MAPRPSRGLRAAIGICSVLAAAAAFVWAVDVATDCAAEGFSVTASFWLMPPVVGFALGEAAYTLGSSRWAPRVAVPVAAALAVASGFAAWLFVVGVGVGACIGS